MDWSACSSARCFWLWAMSCSVNGRTRRCRAAAQPQPRCARRNERLDLRPLALERADQAGNHDREKKLAADHLESRDSACDVGAGQEVTVAKRRQRDEAVIGCGKLRQRIRPSQASGPEVFDGPVDLPKKQASEQI